MNRKNVSLNLGLPALVLVACLVASCQQPTTAPTTATLRLTLQSDSTETVDATHPIRWEISTAATFSSVVKSGSVSTMSATTVDVTVDAGGYYVRAYIDKDNNGSLSYGDSFSIYGLIGTTQLIYSPYKATVAAGDTKSISLSPGVGEQTENDSEIPDNFGTIYFTITYTGAGTVDSAHLLFLGTGQDKTLVTQFMGFNVARNGEKVYAIVPAGTWYAGGFFDIDGNAVMPNGQPDSGDPAEIYDGIALGGEGTPITVAAGSQTAEVALTLSDSILYP